MPHVRRIATVPLLCIAACSSADDGGRTASEPAVRMPLPALGANGPELRFAALAVSRYGHVAFTGGYHEGTELITVIDSGGRLISRLGPSGAGPDELRGANYLLFDDSTLVVADALQGVLKTYALRGEHLATVRQGALLLIFGRVADSIDLADNGADGPRIIRQALDSTAGTRTVVAKGDTLFEALVDRARPVRGQIRFGNGSSPRGVIYVDGLDYSVYELGTPSHQMFGMHLPVNVSAAGDTVSYFGLYSFGTDDSGRLWAAGRDGDTGFLDAWVDAVRVHHQSTTCLPNPLYGMSVAGQWLAMLCEAPEEAPTEVTLQLYRLP